MKKVHFIDCGANVGNAIDWAKNKYKEKLIRIDAFEPEYLNYTHLLEKYFADNTLSIHKEAVWIENEIKEFFVQHWGTRTGSSLMPDKEQVIKKGQYVSSHYMGEETMVAIPDVYKTKDPYSDGYYVTQDLHVYWTNPKRAPCLDFSEWIFKNLSKKNYNVLKIDIEGAEYKVIDHLLNTGAHELIDEWLVELTCKQKTPDSYNQEVVDRFESIVPNYVDWGSTAATEEMKKCKESA